MKGSLDQVHEEELQSLELRISKFLRAGVLFAGAVMLVGWVWTLIVLHSGWGANPYAIFETYHESTLIESVRSAIQAGSWSQIVSYLGLVVLISLPMIRVLLTMILFFRQRERVLGFIALFVMLALMASLLLGFEL